MSIADNFLQINQRIKASALACGRNPNEIRLVTVSKTHSAERIKEAAEAGAVIFGESYIQEAVEKYETLSSSGLIWHFIGHLQTNKARFAVKIFDLIHTVDSLRLAEEIDRQANKIEKNQAILIQVNIAREGSKSGIDPDNALELVKQISRLRHLSIRGLMTIAPFFDVPEKVRPYFAALHDLRNRIRNEDIENVCMDELSMGMTGDFEAAIREGATLVRIGTAIFGERA